MNLKPIIAVAAIAFSGSLLAQTPPNPQIKADQEALKADRERLKTDLSRTKGDYDKLQADRKAVPPPAPPPAAPPPPLRLQSSSTASPEGCRPGLLGSQNSNRA